MKPNFVARKSVTAAFSPWLVAFSWLIIPAIIQIAWVLEARCYVIEFYDTEVIVRSGVLRKRVRQSTFTGVYSVSVSQSRLGETEHYGDLIIDTPDKWDIDTWGIKDPFALERYLKGFLIKEISWKMKR